MASLNQDDDLGPHFQKYYPDALMAGNKADNETLMKRWWTSAEIHELNLFYGENNAEPSSWIWQ